MVTLKEVLSKGSWFSAGGLFGYLASEAKKHDHAGRGPGLIKTALLLGATLYAINHLGPGCQDMVKQKWQRENTLDSLKIMLEYKKQKSPNSEYMPKLPVLRPSSMNYRNDSYLNNIRITRADENPGETTYDASTIKSIDSCLEPLNQQRLSTNQDLSDLRTIPVSSPSIEYQGFQ